ncbi:GNAT family N-acetyltransferase [Pedobacter sp. SAFR-022]|uniref:GNAT family N-acetyltransferase n=1 Tax=Pedobacter sp. SAFR-022 TaxID=3436861 RepID=UPI003F7F55A1
MNNVEIIEYQPEYQTSFERLNKAWLEMYFTLEPIDRYVLEQPEEAILKPGGIILLARYDGKIIGTVALKVIEPGVYEMTKMSVDQAYQGIGAGKKLCAAAIDRAKQINAKRLLLYTTSILETAISIYRKQGFVDVPLEPGVYERANVKMEYPLH